MQKANSNIIIQRLVFGMNEEAPSPDTQSLRSPFLLALLIAFFASSLFGVVVPLTLIGIATTYEVSIGTASQISAVSSAVSVFFALLMCVLSVRFKHKSLLLLGISCIGLSSLGCFLASTFDTLQLVFSLSGIGGVIIGAITYTLVGDFFAIEKRGKVIGLIVATTNIAFIIGSPLTSYIITYAGWRSVFLWLVLPISVAGVLLAYFAIPSKLQQPLAKINSLECFRGVILDKSAMACLIGSMLITASMIIGIYIVTFYNSQFGMPITFGAAIIMVGAIISVIGGILAGHLINWRGRKGSIVMAGILTTIFGTTFVFIPDLWISVTLRCLSVLFGTMTITAFASLSLEQVPQFRGIMMSLISASIGIGGFLGALIGSIILNLYNYQVLALILGVLSIASIIIILWTKEPIKQPSTIKPN
jgi:predicted MFS family arabinose efflux permease